MAKDTGADGQDASDDTTNSLDDVMLPPEPVIPDGPRRNLTREGIYGTIVNQQVNLGKSQKEAEKFAKARAFEMCPD
jgi:hypothetical protein